MYKAKGSPAWARKHKSHEHRWRNLTYAYRYGNLYHVWWSEDIRHVREQWVPIHATVPIQASGFFNNVENPWFEMPIPAREKIYDGSIYRKKRPKGLAYLP